MKNWGAVWDECNVLRDGEMMGWLWRWEVGLNWRTKRIVLSVGGSFERSEECLCSVCGCTLRGGTKLWCELERCSEWGVRWEKASEERRVGEERDGRFKKWEYFCPNCPKQPFLRKKNSGEVCHFTVNFEAILRKFQFKKDFFSVFRNVSNLQALQGFTTECSCIPPFLSPRPKMV